MYSVVKDFNELSQNIRHLVMSCYKSELRQHLLSAQATYLTGVSLSVVWIFLHCVPWITFMNIVEPPRICHGLGGKVVMCGV